jgi:hypothetical protein
MILIVHRGSCLRAHAGPAPCQNKSDDTPLVPLTANEVRSTLGILKVCLERAQWFHAIEVSCQQTTRRQYKNNWLQIADNATRLMEAADMKSNTFDWKQYLAVMMALGCARTEAGRATRENPEYVQTQRQLMKQDQMSAQDNNSELNR